MVYYPALQNAAFTYPIIDNHTHPLLKAEHRDHDAFKFEGLISEAQGGALTEDAPHTVACLKATKDLATLFQLPVDATWEDVKAARSKIPYGDLCKMCMAPARIQCVLLDDGLGGVSEYAEGYKWHDQFTTSPSKRIVRVEVVAQDVFKALMNTVFQSDPRANPTTGSMATLTFLETVEGILRASATDPEVAGFKSVACYRTGLNISLGCTRDELMAAIFDVWAEHRGKNTIRFANKVLNDWLVRLTLTIAGEYDKPVQFHTGLGDNDITLSLSSPAHMQLVIKAYPKTKFVLLHSSYPYTRDAGYLTAVYKNVFLDFGEVFPFVSPEGQRAVVRQVLELAPTNKIMWSTDGHFWPESYYVATVQGRKAIYEVLSESLERGELTEQQAVTITENALFHNANMVYRLGLTAQLS